MRSVLDVVKQNGIACLACERVSLDFERFSEYTDSDEHPVESPFERPRVVKGKKQVVEVASGIPTILRYFLDGSRRTYKVADAILGGRYLPIIAGQVGVAVIARDDDGHLKPMRDFCCLRNIIAFPDKLAGDDLAHLQTEINEHCRVQFLALRYTVKPDRDPVDLGIARIMSEMHMMEVDTVSRIAARHLLANDRLLVVDGPLRFKKSFDLVQFRNVLGISKTFRPSFRVRKHREDVGALASSLDFGERTSVFKIIDDDKVLGAWYLRLRNPSLMPNPLDGIVKVECYAIDPEDKEEGFDSDRIDTISGHILRERNVTPYGSDSRWASHIYPIYMAESYVRTLFMSTTAFTALF